MRLGVHMRIGGGLDAAARTAAEIGCETIQIFAGNPSAWRSRRIDPQSAATFQSLVRDYELSPVAVHTQYLLNLASPDDAIYEKSKAALVDNLERASSLAAQYVVTHIGSHRGAGLATGVGKVRMAVSSALDQAGDGVMLLLENSAGGGDAVGAPFDHIALILEGLDGYRERLGICLDTAHLWAAGYDVSTAEALSKTLDEFDSAIGIGRLKLLHLNDTTVSLGSRRDRHANIGLGCIGAEGFTALLHHPSLENLAGIVETPARTDGLRDIDILKDLRG